MNNTLDLFSEFYSCLSEFSTLTEGFKEHETSPTISNEAVQKIAKQLTLTKYTNATLENESRLNEWYQESLTKEIRILLECEVDEKEDIDCLGRFYRSLISGALQKLEMQRLNISSNFSNAQMISGSKDSEDSPNTQETTQSITSDSSLMESDNFSFDDATFSSSSPSPIPTELFSLFNQDELLNNKQSALNLQPYSSLITPPLQVGTVATERRIKQKLNTQNRHTQKRQNISPAIKKTLESVFVLKKNPNSRERKLLAEKCRLSTAQVRIWFANKRARTR